MTATQKQLQDHPLSGHAAGTSQATATLDVAPARPTWRDWIGADRPVPATMVTRDDLIAQLRDADIDVSSDSIALWQRRGLLPYPTKRREGHATIGYYPDWVADLIRELRRLQGEGQSLEQIGPRLRAFARHITGPKQDGHVTTKPGPPLALNATDAAPTSFGPIVDALARIYGSENGTTIQRVELRLVDDRGNPVSFTFNI